MELVVTRHIWGRGLTAEQMQEKLASALDDGHRHMVNVRRGQSGQLPMRNGRIIKVAATKFAVRHAVRVPSHGDLAERVGALARPFLARSDDGYFFKSIPIVGAVRFIEPA